MISDNDKSEIFRMADDKMSAGQIAAALGLTRCQVMGHIHRASLAGRVFPMSKGRLPSRAVLKPSKPKKVAPPPPDEPESIGPIGTFPDRKSCQFMRGEPTARDEDGRLAFQMCGHPGYPWCDYHHHRCTDRTRKASADAE